MSVLFSKTIWQTHGWHLYFYKPLNILNTMATNSLDAVLAQYEKAKQGGSSNTSKFTQEERMKKYFAAILTDK